MGVLELREAVVALVALEAGGGAEAIGVHGISSASSGDTRG